MNELEKFRFHCFWCPVLFESIHFLHDFIIGRRGGRIMCRVTMCIFVWDKPHICKVQLLTGGSWIILTFSCCCSGSFCVCGLVQMSSAERVKRSLLYITTQAFSDLLSHNNTYGASMFLQNK